MILGLRLHQGDFGFWSSPHNPCPGPQALAQPLPSVRRITLTLTLPGPILQVLLSFLAPTQCARGPLFCLDRQGLASGPLLHPQGCSLSQAQQDFWVERLSRALPSEGREKIPAED